MNKFLLMALINWAAIPLLQAAPSVTPLFTIAGDAGTFMQVPLNHSAYLINPAGDGAFVVLDGQHNPLPGAITPWRPQETTVQSHINHHTVPFFAVAAETSAQALKDVLISRSLYQGDQLKRITTTDSLSPQTADFYLLDLREVQEDINALIFEWENNAQNQFLLVQLDASQDLLNWHSLGQGSLVQVQEQGQSLIHNRINLALAKQTFAYLRLTILRGAEHLRITQISAEEQHLTHTPPAAALERWSLAGTVAKEQTSAYAPRAHSPGNPVRAFEFSRQESAPAEQLSIHLGTQPYANSLRLFARATPQDAWQLIHQGIWFNTQVGTTWQTAEPIDIDGNRAQYWRVEFAAGGPIDAAELVFSWHPPLLQFIANNTPPFTLASSDDNGSFNRAQVFHQLVAKHTAAGPAPIWTDAQLIALSTPPALSAQKTGLGINWRTGLFWLALIGAVALLALLAWRLLKQLNTPENQN